MVRKLIFLFSYVIFLTIGLFSQQYISNTESTKYLRENLEYLASDELEGREATTHGEDLAAEFLSNKLIEYGVHPYADDKTFFQTFEVDVRKVDTSSYFDIISVDNSIIRMQVGKDFYLSTTIMPSKDFNDLESEIVFAGFGITAPDYEYDDYDGVDAEGKVVLIYRGAPMRDEESLFSNEDHRKFADPEFKIKNAAEHGAAGILVIPTEFAMKHWNWIKRNALSSDFSLIDNLTDRSESIPSAMLSEEAVSALLNKERYSYQELAEALEDEEIPEWFLLSKKTRFSYNVRREIRSSKNIIGMIVGTDPQLKNEFVTIGAHYDHEGIVNGEIYNGADDNASGSVAILEAGRRLVELNNNKRSVLIIFHAAEEKGLLGSKYLTANSNFMEDVVVHINVDMVGREHVDTIYSVGSDKLSSELKEIVEEANEETVEFNFNYKFDDPNDPQRIYYRSDHYNYAKKGIPIVFFYDYMLEDYHKTTDDAEKINYIKIDKVSTLITEIALRIANLGHKLAVDSEEVVEESE